MKVGFTLTRIAALSTLICAAAADAQIALVPGTLNMFRDTRAASDVGITQGDRFQFGANIAGGSADVSLGATYGPTGFTVAQFPCNPLAVNPFFCSRTTAYSEARLDPWTLRFVRGAQTLEVLGPDLHGTEVPVPFPVSVSMSGTGLNPTISWTIPGGSGAGGFVPDGFRVNIYDKGRMLPSGQADIIHSVAIDPAASFYTIPSLLNNSMGIGLSLGGNYTINFQLVETRGHVPFTNNNAEILRRSSSFFAFTPLTGSVPDEIALPSVVDGVYNFNITDVGPASVTFIDPFVAVGYDYAIGAGDPNFASVLLPDVGDGVFTVSYVDGSGAQSAQVEDGEQFFFGPGGVSTFRVTGIETSAGLDPADVTAFITGLTFAANGSFTGTMTPITVEVPIPEPGSWALMALGLAGLAKVRRRRT